MTRAHPLTCLLLAATLVAGGAAASGAPPAAPEPVHRKAPSTRVFAISVDGLNPRALTRLGPRRAPSFHRLLAQGAGTRNARTEVEQTQTMSNHASMFTGRRIDADHGGHGVTWDDDRPGTTVQQAAGHPVESVFDVVDDAGWSTALFASKAKFSLYRRSWPSIRRYEYRADNTRLVKRARNDLVRTDRAFTLLHLSMPDLVGHASGFMSESYVDAVAETDALLGKLLRAVDRHPDLAAELVLVLTGDHGGVGRDHSNRFRLANYRVPFVAWGDGVSAGDLYEMNPDYRNPGKARPRYAGLPPVRNGDLANLATDLLGLGPVQGSLLNASQTLDIGPASEE